MISLLLIGRYLLRVLFLIQLGVLNKQNKSFHPMHFDAQNHIFDNTNAALNLKNLTRYDGHTSLVAGYMTLNNIAKKNNVPVSSMLNYFSILKKKADERLGRLK